LFKRNGWYSAGIGKIFHNGHFPWPMPPGAAGDQEEIR
jgi:hypothetical protein